MIQLIQNSKIETWLSRFFPESLKSGVLSQYIGNWFILCASIRTLCIFFLLSVPAVVANDAWAQAEKAAQHQDFEAAIANATLAIAGDAQQPNWYYQRGRWNFFVGQFDASLKDFDRLIELAPQSASRLWERGITCYYAGKFLEGARQFEAYQTYHSNDVENAIWRYLCQQKIDGSEQAKLAMLPIERDSRVPMMEIYDLFRGKAEPEVVLQRLASSTATGVAAKVEQMHGHLYLGLFHDAQGNLELARQQIDLSVGQFEREGGYMWHVAKQHQAELRKRKKL